MGAERGKQSLEHWRVLPLNWRSANWAVNWQVAVNWAVSLKRLERVPRRSSPQQVERQEQAEHTHTQDEVIRRHEGSTQSSTQIQ